MRRWQNRFCRAIREKAEPAAGPPGKREAAIFPSAARRPGQAQTPRSAFAYNKGEAPRLPRGRIGRANTPPSALPAPASRRGPQILNQRTV